jgi:rhodanese-related sulfurtransferase
MPITQWSAKQLQENLQDKPALLLLDVREANEFAYAHIKDSMHIPLNRLPERYKELDKEQGIVLICHHGMRSQQACVFLQDMGFTQLYNLHGGIDAWSVNCDSSVPRY